VTARLSPRRRLLVVAAVVLLATAGVLGLALTRGEGTGGGTRVAQDKPGPVLLVPGYGGGTGGLAQLAQRLAADGRKATIVALPGNGTGDLDAQATALDAAVNAVLASGDASSVDVVGYSAGGLVARIWARDHDGAARARRIVTLGSPHHGTDLAAVAGLVLSSCPLACRQMAPGSDVISSLNAGDETPDGPEWISIWSNQDQVVSPPETAHLDGARNVVVQHICPGRAVDHGQLPTDAVVDALVLRALAVAPFITPAPADCAALSEGR
jgi:triacylglycerol esterase/lipase EstA (alpha/beta hydrolase family)